MYFRNIVYTTVVSRNNIDESLLFLNLLVRLFFVHFNCILSFFFVYFSV